MEKKFYLAIFCILSCSVILLGMSYSKKSSDAIDTELQHVNNDSYKAVYSNNEYLDTKDNNSLRISLVNKNKKDTNYALYLREVNNKKVENVYYSINGGEEYLLTEEIINLGTLTKYGTNGDTYIFDITLRGIDTYNFYYSIGEVSYGS